VFKIKTKSGGIVGNIVIAAKDIEAAKRRSPISNAIEARKRSLGNWYRKKHRWDVPMGESVANFSLGTESQRWHIILPWKSGIA